MPAVNRTSLNLALARHRQEFERLRAVAGADPGMVALVDALFHVAGTGRHGGVGEDHTQGLPELRPAGSQTPPDRTARGKPGAKGRGPQQTRTDGDHCAARPGDPRRARGEMRRVRSRPLHVRCSAHQGYDPLTAVQIALKGAAARTLEDRE